MHVTCYTHARVRNPTQRARNSTWYMHELVLIVLYWRGLKRWYVNLPNNQVKTRLEQKYKLNVLFYRQRGLLGVKKPKAPSRYEKKATKFPQRKVRS